MNIKLDLTINEVNSVLGVLGKLPYDQVVTLINKMRTQVEEQMRPPPATPPVELMPP